MSHEQQGETNVSPPHVSETDVLPINSESESLDSVFRALSDHRRRCICHYLARTDGPVKVTELAELLAASMSEKTRAVLTSEEIEKTRTELIRMHLPKLTEAGIVEHDSDENVVKLADSPGVRDCLEAASGVDLG
jgi:DNA-binding transcriptional ArsR family regulator